MDIVGFSEKQQKILQFLVKEKEGMTVDQFSKLLEISKSAIHQHLTVLERDGFVRKSASKQTGGRPGTLFVLTEKGEHIFPKHYSLFAKMLITLIKQKLGSEELVEYLQELGVSLAITRKDALKNKPIEEKINMAATIMQELGYETEVVEGEPGENLIIDAYNCVFYDLAYDSPEICEMDLSILSTLLDRKIEHTFCLAKGGHSCRFKVHSLDKDKTEPPS
ncbi:MAG: ArsR family transcriptional regulator [Methylococcales bacterium]|nr:ArsR family transcriptional regulator [Methylococcales bacterium]